MHIENLKNKRYEVSERTFSLKKANIVGAAIVLPVAAVLFIIYNTVMTEASKNNVILVIAIFFAGLAVHELIHGFVWHFSCEDKWNSIKFGIDKKTLSPYTVCGEIIPIRTYKLGVILPGIITGVVPYIAGLMINNSVIAYSGILLICAAVGDMMILCTIFNVDKDSLVKDHPTMCGCIVYKHIK